MSGMINYWFLLEPYVYVRLTKGLALLYNTLDGVYVETRCEEIISLLRDILDKENCGVTLLTKDQFENEDVICFITEMRDKFMGDIIDTRLSKGKPVQLLPYYNYENDKELYKKHNFSPLKNVLTNLEEIVVYLDKFTNVQELVAFLQSVHRNVTFNLIGDIEDVVNNEYLLLYLNQQASLKIIESSYQKDFIINSDFENNYSRKLVIAFPVDLERLNYAIAQLLDQICPVEYVFNISSDKDYIEAESLVYQYNLENYSLKPIYTGENLSFFKNNVFLNKKDILSRQISMQDIFANQLINIYNFGKISIMSNGDIFANINDPVLGNIATSNIYEVIQKEIDEGHSWFRIRNQSPCDNCVYQWICPSPSDYEYQIGCMNLCHECALD